MPSNGRWRHLEIVVPTPSRAQEISSGIKNALDRGELLEKAKRSFINAGYTPQEVNAAAQIVRSGPSGFARPLKAPQSQQIPPQPNQQNQTSSPKDPTSEPKSKRTIIILSIVGAVILVAALALTLFWDKIF